MVIDKYIESRKWEEEQTSSKTPIRKWKLTIVLVIKDNVNTDKIVDYMEIRGDLVKINDKFKIGLVLFHDQRMIERGGFRNRHRNPDDEWIQIGHKHKISQEFQDKVAFIPDDVDWSDANRAFKDILKEWNVIEQTGYPNLPSEYFDSGVTEFISQE